MEKMALDLFRKIYTGKKVLVTGNTGFKGSWLSSWLQQLGATVIGFSDRIPTKPSFYEANGLPDRVNQYWGDVRDQKALEKCFRETRPDFIFHLAAQALVKESLRQPLDTFTINAIGTAHVLDVLREADYTCSVVIITSDKCYENLEWVWGYKETDMLGGKDPYSASKAAAEIIFHSYYHTWFANHPYIRLATARAGNVIGGGDWALDRIVPDCVKHWSEHKTVKIRRPHFTRPWQHVLEPLGGYLLLGTLLYEGINGIKGQSFNFGPPANQDFSVGELIKDLAACWTHSDALSLIHIEEDASFYEAGLLKLNTDKALALLGWQPVLNYVETMKLTGEWYDYYYGSNQTVDQLRAFSDSQILFYVNAATEKSLIWMN